MRWRLLARGGLAMLTAVALVAVAGGDSVHIAPASVVAQQGDDPALLRELAERLLAGSSGGGRFIEFGGGADREPPPPEVELLVGELPRNLGFDPPMQPGSRLLGSVRRRPARFGDFEIVLDVPGAVTDIAAFYEQEMTARGWLPGRSLFEALGDFRGGFSDANARPVFPPEVLNDPRHRVFCAERGARMPSLSVDILSSRNGLHDVRLRGGGISSLECPNLVVPEGRPLRLPEMILPDDARVIGGACSGSSTNESCTGVRVHSNRNVADLEADIAAQLTAAGWTRRDGGAETLLAWSEWSVPDRPDWHGFLTVVAEPGLDIRFLSLNVRSDAADTPRRPPFP